MSNIALGDFNHDGNLDMVVASQFGTSVLVLLNNSGDGTFPSQQYYDIGALPNAVALGDFNRDGNLDIVTGNEDGTISVLLGNGDGTFQAPPLRRPSVGSVPVDVAVGDFNRDGNLDILTNNYHDNATVTIFLGNGDGTFQLYQHYPSGVWPGAVAVGDFTHDRTLDIVTTSGHEANNAVTVSLGNGNGTFQPYQDYDVGPTPADVALGDFNNDGILDIVTANALGGTLSVLLGKGDGTFTAAKGSPYSVGNGKSPDAVAVGDVNHDGNLDIVTANQDSGTVSVLLGNGDGTFTAAKGSPYSVGDGKSPNDVAVGDFTNDGNLDIVTANYAVINEHYQLSITIFYGNGDGTFGPAKTL